jgi:hypothetical protein
VTAGDDRIVGSVDRGVDFDRDSRSLKQRRLLDPAAAAAAWWDERYLPACDAMRRAGVQEAFPYRTEGDLFLVLHERRQNLFPGHAAVTLAQAAADSASRTGSSRSNPAEYRLMTTLDGRHAQ